jgi:exodeoxyribonuclease-3
LLGNTTFTVALPEARYWHSRHQHHRVAMGSAVMRNRTALHKHPPVISMQSIVHAYTARMKFYSWNVNGIRAVVKKGTFQKFVKDHKPDILCLQETKAEKGQAEIDLPDYREYWNSAEKKGYSGTAIFSRTEPLKVINGFPDAFAKKFTFADELKRDAWNEGRVITAEYDKFYAVTVYTPNAKDDLSRVNLRHKHWDPAFLAYCKQLEKKKPVVFCGDLNVAHTEDDLANPKPNRGKKGFTDEEREGFQNFIDAGFVDTFRIFTKGNGHYSWWSHFANARARNVGWRIDYILVSDALKKKVKDAKIHADVLGSDHCPVSITLDI